MVKYIVKSKWPSQKRYQVERSYVLKTYANDMAKALRKAGKNVKIETK